MARFATRIRRVASEAGNDAANASVPRDRIGVGFHGVRASHVGGLPKTRQVGGEGRNALRRQLVQRWFPIGGRLAKAVHADHRHTGALPFNDVHGSTLLLECLRLGG